MRVPGEDGRAVLFEKPGPPAMDEATAAQVRELIAKGASGFSVGFTTDDCRKTYERFRDLGVAFTQEPVEHSYGTDIGIRDPFGNHIRIVQFPERTMSEGALRWPRREAVGPAEVFDMRNA